MMDNGFPLTTEPNILKEMITPPNIVNKMLNVVTSKSSTLGSKLPDAAASFVPWRRTTVKDASNEVYVNIVEELDACVNREGVLVKCEAYGEVQVNYSLPGVPELTMSFANTAIINDVTFHPCV
ncbi:AP-3 complex subunit mu [Zea mays]|uniref:AP-3 complex subunit mu n=1 Tax=Zea mays TaxID=4577 RepID=A0A1D6KP28_MAIZE|nr:AP-3 complex subunit mu [Zea mays]